MLRSLSFLHRCSATRLCIAPLQTRTVLLTLSPYSFVKARRFRSPKKQRVMIGGAADLPFFKACFPECGTAATIVITYARDHSFHVPSVENQAAPIPDGLDAPPVSRKLPQ